MTQPLSSFAIVSSLTVAQLAEKLEEFLGCSVTGTDITPRYSCFSASVAASTPRTERTFRFDSHAFDGGWLEITESDLAEGWEDWTAE